MCTRLKQFLLEVGLRSGAQGHGDARGLANTVPELLVIVSKSTRPPPTVQGPHGQAELLLGSGQQEYPDLSGREAVSVAGCPVRTGKPRAVKRTCWGGSQGPMSPGPRGLGSSLPRTSIFCPFLNILAILSPGPLSPRASGQEAGNSLPRLPLFTPSSSEQGGSRSLRSRVAMRALLRRSCVCLDIWRASCGWGCALGTGWGRPVEGGGWPQGRHCVTQKGPGSTTLASLQVA